jgi:hypothetical protein
MALHRDIYWVGRQWAVTGFGVQAVDQRLKGAFDIEIARLWEDGLQQRMRALVWLKADDFDKALDIARTRFPEPPRKSLPLVESILEMIPSGGRGETPKLSTSPIEAGPPTVNPPKIAATPIEARPPPAEPAVAPLAPNVPASKPPPRMVIGSKPVPPPAPPSQAPAASADSVSASKPASPVARPAEAGVNVSRPAKRLVAAIEPAPVPATPPKPAAAPAETKVTASKPAAIEPPPVKFQPLALRIEHASAKFLPRWRVRH